MWNLAPLFWVVQKMQHDGDEELVWKGGFTSPHTLLKTTFFCTPQTKQKKLGCLLHYFAFISKPPHSTLPLAVHRFHPHFCSWFLISCDRNVAICSPFSKVGAVNCVISPHSLVLSIQGGEMLVLFTNYNTFLPTTITNPYHKLY